MPEMALVLGAKYLGRLAEQVNTIDLERIAVSRMRKRAIFCTEGCPRVRTAKSSRRMIDPTRV